MANPDETYVPTRIGRGLWRSPAGFVYRSDKLFTGDELRRQEAAAGFDVGPVPPRSAEEIRLAYGQRQPNPARYSFDTPPDSQRRNVTESQDAVARRWVTAQRWPMGRTETSSSAMREAGELSSPNAARDDCPAQVAFRHSAERQTSQVANADVGPVREDARSGRPSIPESEKSVSVNARMVRSELSATVSALDVQNSTGNGRVWEAKVAFESSERGYTSALAGALVCVAVLGVVVVLFARDHILKHQSSSLPEIRK